MGFHVSRRGFLKGWLLLIGAVLAKGILDFMTSETQGTVPDKDIFIDTVQLAEGSVMLGQKKVVWLVRDEQGYYALDRRCTHLGCSVRWQEEQRQFICPCHNSRYDLRGNIISGPAPSRLVPVKLSRDKNGNLIADRKVVVDPGWRLTITG